MVHRLEVYVGLSFPIRWAQLTILDSLLVEARLAVVQAGIGVFSPHVQAASFFPVLVWLDSSATIFFNHGLSAVG